MKRIKRKTKQTKTQTTYRYLALVEIFNKLTSESVGRASISIYSEMKLITPTNIESAVALNLDELSNIDMDEHFTNILQWIEM